ncbi:MULTISPECIES: hypothetical protein [Vibrio]
MGNKRTEITEPTEPPLGVSLEFGFSESTNSKERDFLAFLA